MVPEFNRQTVLIVENDQPTLWLYQRAIEQEYNVLGASNKDDVMALFKTHSIDAVVLEPGPINSQGWALLVELKHSPDLVAIPIVLCTTQDERRRGLELGSAAYLIKPVLPAVLLDTVRNLTRSESTKEVKDE